MSAFLGTLLRLSLLGSVGALVLTALGPLLRRTAERVNGPVLANFPFGHTLPIATIDFHRPIAIENNRVRVL